MADDASAAAPDSRRRVVAGQSPAVRRGQDDRPDDGVVRGQRRGQRVAQTVDLAGPRRDPVGDRLVRRPGSARRRSVDGRRAADRRGGRQSRGRRRRTGRAATPAATGAGVGRRDRDRHGLAVARARPSTGSSRSAIGRRVVESGTPGRALTSVASRTRASGRRRATTMWSAPVAVASSSTIAPRIASGETERDRLDRMRAKDLGLLAAADLERGDRLAMADGREADDEDEPDDGPVGRTRPLRADPEDRDQAEDEEGGGEDPPGASRSRFRRVRGSSRPAGGVAHVRDQGWRSRPAASIPGPGTDGGGRPVPSSYPPGRQAAAMSPAAAASWPPSRLTRYRALSAAAMRSVALRPSAGNVATPMDAPIGTGPRCSPT